MYKKPNIMQKKKWQEEEKDGIPSRIIKNTKIWLKADKNNQRCA